MGEENGFRFLYIIFEGECFCPMTAKALPKEETKIRRGGEHIE
jgi:hypothetical protein